MRRRLTTILSAAFVAALAAAAACDSQRSTAYRGEPLAVLQGTVETTGTAQPPPLDVALDWMGFAGLSPTGMGAINVPAETRVPVSGQFPTFTLDLMTPPPDEVLAPCHSPKIFNDNDAGAQAGERFAFAHIEAIAQGADVTDPFSVPEYGEAFEFRVVYVDQDTTACDLLSEYTPPVLSKGYHLLKRVAGPCPTSNDVGWFPGICGQFSEVPLTTTIEMTVQADPVKFSIPSLSNLNAGPNCQDPQEPPLPADSMGGSPCRLFIIQDGPSSPSLDCSGPGLTPASPLAQAQLFHDFQQDGNVCEVAQVPPSAWANGSCAQSSQPGWCYVTGSAAGTCSQGGGVFFSAPATPLFSTPIQPLLIGQFICP
jgi:hypothetical protein